MCSNLAATSQVGQILNQVNLETTIVIFFSDHGFALGERAHWCKNGNFDVHARVPMMISLPKSHRLAREDSYKGNSITQPVQLLDLYPTVISLAIKSVSQIFV
jgi:iduronate 2-sulfatase